MRRVAVLGAGLQGACAAMELADLGIAVDLFDRLPSILAATSVHNEGKIHLGYVYAHDPSLRTARLMVRGALSFLPLLRRWIGASANGLPLSQPFHYGVHRQSLVGPDEVERHFRACAALAREEAGDQRLEYFDRDPLSPPRRLPSTEGLFGADVTAAFSTQEIGLDPRALCAAVRARVACTPEIRCRLRSTIRAVELDDAEVRVVFEHDGREEREAYDQVVNALWESRLAIDASAGLRPHRPWLLRQRHYLRGDSGLALDQVPSATTIVGPFGDVIRFGNGAFHLSWYPVGMTATSRSLEAPAWDPLDPDRAETVGRRTIEALAALVPSLTRLGSALDEATLESGVVFAWGATGLDDARSALHTRSDVGVTSRGRYHSIDTGKLTTAPLFAAAAARRVLAV